MISKSLIAMTIESLELDPDTQRFLTEIAENSDEETIDEFLWILIYRRQDNLPVDKKDIVSALVYIQREENSAIYDKVSRLISEMEAITYGLHEDIDRLREIPKPLTRESAEKLRLVQDEIQKEKDN